MCAGYVAGAVRKRDFGTGPILVRLLGEKQKILAAGRSEETRVQKKGHLHFSGTAISQKGNKYGANTGKRASRVCDVCVQLACAARAASPEI